MSSKQQSFSDSWIRSPFRGLDGDLGDVHSQVHCTPWPERMLASGIAQCNTHISGLLVWSLLSKLPWRTFQAALDPALLQKSPTSGASQSPVSCLPVPNELCSVDLKMAFNEAKHSSISETLAVQMSLEPSCRHPQFSVCSELNDVHMFPHLCRASCCVPLGGAPGCSVITTGTTLLVDKILGPLASSLTTRGCCDVVRMFEDCCESFGRTGLKLARKNTGVPQS